MVDNSVQHSNGNNGGANTSTTTVFNWSTVYNTLNDGYESVAGISYNNNGGLFGARDGLYFGAAIVRTYDPDTYQPIDTFTEYQGGVAKVSNGGAIYGGPGVGGFPAGAGIDFGAGVGAATVTNHSSGAIEGPVGIYSEATNTKITNAGSISGIYAIELQGSAHGTITNTGTIQGDTYGVLVNAQSFKIVNTGTILGDTDSIFAQQITTVDNRGNILGNAVLRGTLNNSGDIDGSVTFGADTDVVKNSGFIDGDLQLGDSNDIYTAAGSSGHVDGTISGGAGIDRLTGGSEDDWIEGGANRDILRGNGGADTFDYNFATDCGITSKTRDRIADFKHDVDTIDLSDIDADATPSGNQAFTFMASEGAAFTGAHGQLRFDQFDLAGAGDDYTMIYADFDGDKVSDFQIALTGLISLTAGDFIL